LDPRLASYSRWNGRLCIRAIQGKLSGSGPGAAHEGGEYGHAWLLL